MNSADLRIPPHSIEAEQSLIGGLLLDNTAWDRIADMVTEADFYRDDHRRIFAHIRKLVETGRPADVVTIYESIEKSNEVDQTGGLAYLGEIANATPSAANIRRYAEIVAERRALRDLICAAGEIMAIAEQPGPEGAEDRIDRSQAVLIALADKKPSQREPAPIGEVLGRAVSQVEEAFNADGDVVGTPTGFADVDRLLYGMQPGDMIVVAGRPSMGKTAFALNIAEHVAVERRLPVAVFSLEMGDTQLAKRALASQGGIEHKKLRTGKLQDDDWDRMTVALGRLHEAPIHIDETASLSPAQIRARSRRVKVKNGGRLGLIVIDYLQLMTSPKDAENRTNEVSAISRAIKAMAKELGCPVIALSQLSRKVEERTNKRPLMSDLRESGAVEQDADVILLMYRDDYYNPSSQDQGIAEVNIAKHRNGETGVVSLLFEPQYSRFRDLAGEDLRRFDHARATAKVQQGRGRGFDE
jgi:replicative DNA helicase